ncbi:DnaJ family protein [Hondaea fermentalgiana]|uniref:DnaJ family protein n=1 Tax=Hondaea fermentalgiana TaxID=2315210 RepID=A0A2R5GI11_9STRA|nr:DnaJ family protein [Hondaea fermentalgiana]|eukprot:GBG29959.1 DnaJ family protein [Hondaea fermentalgiana]
MRAIASLTVVMAIAAVTVQETFAQSHGLPNPCGNAPSLAAWSMAHRRRLCAQGPDASAEAVSCVAALADVFGQSELIELCADATSALDVEHCVQSMSNAAWNKRDVIRLCAGASSSAVGQCANLMREDPSFSKFQVASLCAMTPQGAGASRASCARKALRLASFHTDYAVELCRLPERAAAACAETASTGNRALAASEVVRVCQGADTLAPGQCVSACGNISPSLCAAICRGAKSSEPGRCAEAAAGRLKCVKQTPQQVETMSRLALCNGTTSETSTSQTGPSTCIRDMLRSNAPISLSDMLRLCQADGSWSRAEEHGAARAKCMRSFRQRNPPLEAALALCRSPERARGISGDMQLRCLADAAKVDSTLSTNLLLDLCTGARDTGPSYCLQRAYKLGFVLNSDEASTLLSTCAKDSLAGICCVEALHRAISRPELAQVANFGALACQSPPAAHCHGPADCFADAVAKKLHPSFAAQLCVTAKDSYPAQCATQLRKANVAGKFHIADDRILDICTQEKAPMDLGIERRDPAACLVAGRPLLKARVFDRPQTRLEELCLRAAYGLDAVDCVMAHKQLIGAAKAESGTLVDLCTSVPNGTRAITDCVVQAPLGTPFRERLCLGSEFPAPATCASVLKSSTRLDDELIVQACQAVTDDGDAVARCVIDGIEAKVKRVTKRAVIQLCKPGEEKDSFVTMSGAERAQRAAQLAEVLGVKPSEIAMLVRASVSPECAHATSQRGFSIAEIARVCGGESQDNPTVACLQTLSPAFSTTQALRLCARSSSERNARIARCIQAGSNGGLDNPVSITTLCEGAPSLDRSRDISSCLRFGLEIGVAQTNAARLCANATSETPIRCFAELQRNSAIIDEVEALSLCSVDPQEAPSCVANVFASARDFEKRNLASFCATPTANASVACVQAAPFTWSLHEKTILCRDTTGQIIKLCQNATDLRPVSCAQTLFPMGGTMLALAASSPEGSQQLKVLLRMRRVGAAEYLPAANLDTTEVVYEPGAWISFPTVRVIDVSGDFEFVASFASLPHIRSSIIKLSVHRDMDEALRAMSRCASIPVRLQCELGASPMSSNEADLHFVSRPWAWWLLARGCEDELADIGVQLLRSPQPIAHGVFLHIKSGPAKLLAGIGVPTEEMSAEEILGVEANATSSQLRKAYYRASLEWHPDRWVSFHPDLQSQAADVFQRIATASRELQDRLSSQVKDGSAEDVDHNCQSSA